jgi:Ser/Thr protein kinase RdoA (MazF antagonist)
MTRAVLDLAAWYGVDRVEPVVLADGSNLLVHLAPAPVVARVATLTGEVRPDVAATHAKDVALAGYLAERGAPVIAPSRELPPGPHDWHGRVVSFWTYVEHDRDHVWRPDEVGPLLADLHAELRDFPGALPRMPPLEITDLLAFLGDDPLLSDDDRAALVADAVRVETTLDLTDSVPLHGDAHPGNLLHTATGPVWTDFEDSWRGPVGWDLACLRRTGRLDGAAAVASYPDAPDDAALAPFLAARRLQGVVWSLVFLRRFPSRERLAHARARLAEWRGG